MTDVLPRPLRERPLSGSGLGTSNEDYEGALLPDRFAPRKWQVSAEAAVQGPAGQGLTLVECRRQLSGDSDPYSAIRRL